MSKNSILLGNIGERIAALYLQREGMQVLETNYRIRGGEIDLIAKEQHTYVFVEVKSRTSDRYGRGVDAVDARKQRVLLRTAQKYLYERGLEEKSARFDVIEIDFSRGKPRLRHLRDVLFE